MRHGSLVPWPIKVHKIIPNFAKCSIRCQRFSCSSILYLGHFCVFWLQAQYSNASCIICSYSLVFYYSVLDLLGPKPFIWKDLLSALKLLGVSEGKNLVLHAVAVSLALQIRQCAGWAIRTTCLVKNQKYKMNNHSDLTQWLNKMKQRRNPKYTPPPTTTTPP